MESRDGFRRRVAVVSTCKNTPDISSVEDSQEPTARGNYVKFSKVNANNHAILNSRKKDQQFQKIIKEIEKRKCTFYRMGFRSYEKHGQKKLFSEVLNLSRGQMKGTMHVGQLWSNHEVNRFLKENKIFMTKLKLMDKMQTLKKQLAQAQKNDEAQSDIGAISTKSIGTCHQIGLRPIERCSNASSTGKLEFQKNLYDIQGELRNLKKTTGQRKLGGDLKYLERCQEDIGKMERRYFLKMIDLV